MPANKSSQFLQPNWWNARNKELEAECNFWPVKTTKLTLLLTPTEDRLRHGRASETEGHCCFPDLGGTIFSVVKLQTVALVTKKTPWWLASLPLHVFVVGDRERVAAVWFSWCPSSQKKMTSFCHCKEKLCSRNLASWSEGKWYKLPGIYHGINDGSLSNTNGTLQVKLRCHMPAVDFWAVATTLECWCLRFPGLRWQCLCCTLYQPHCCQVDVFPE